jgi:hypothetical protein
VAVAVEIHGLAGGYRDSLRTVIAVRPPR